jgi:uncharacterized protein YegL
MVRIFRISILFSIFTLVTFSQNFSVTGFDLTSFPRVKAIFSARNALGVDYSDLNTSNFIVKENNIVVPNSLLQLNCKQSDEIPELSIMLVIDVSGSMKEILEGNDPNNNRFKWVKQGVEKFLDRVQFVGRTEVSITTFSGGFEERCPFTNDKKRLMDSLDKAWLAGPTKYDPPLLDESMGAIKRLADRPADIRRVLIFLTDGKPDTPPKEQEIIQKCNQNGITFYGITFLNVMEPSLSNISSATSGKSFEVLKKEDLEGIYDLIALEIQKRSICELSWNTNYACSPSQIDRAVEIEFTKDNFSTRVNRNYNVPTNGIIKTTFSEKLYTFGNPDIGIDNAVSRTISMTTDNTVFNITKTDFIPSTTFFKIKGIYYKGNLITIPYNLPKGEKVDIVIEFVQEGAKDLRQTNLIIDNGYCIQKAPLFGGASNVVLVSPDQPESFKTCEEIIIKWAGVETDQPVDISYSSDDGATWKVLQNNATGLTYTWKNIPPAGTKYKVKVVVNPTSQHRWVKTIGTDDDQVGKAIEMTKDALSLWVAGYFRNKIEFSNTFTRLSQGDLDMFVARYDLNGNLLGTPQVFGGSGRDTITGIVVEPTTGDLYITGSISNGALFGSSPAPGSLNGTYLFLAKVFANGNSPAVATIGPKSPWTTFNAWARNIRYDAVNKKIIINGRFRGQHQGNFEGCVGQTAVNPNFTNPTPPATDSPFNVEFEDKNGFLILTKTALGSVSGTFTNDTVYSADRNDYYYFGTNSASTTLSNIPVVNRGGKDAILFKFGKSPRTADSSEFPFTIETPTLAFKTNSLDLGKSYIGVITDKLESQLILNPGTRNVKIDSVKFEPNDEFSLRAALVNKEVKPGAGHSESIEFIFQPKQTGVRTATFTLYGNCASPIKLVLTGLGECGTEALPNYQFVNKSNLNIKIVETVSAIFNNPNNGTVRIQPSIDNPEFKIENIRNGSKSFTSGNALDVDPLSTVDIDISFTPTTEGNRSAVLDFGIAASSLCTPAKTNLNAVGVNSELSVLPLKFGIKRIKTKNTAELEITNVSINPAVIDSVWLDNNINFSILPNQFPLNIAGSAKGKVKVTFLPQTEQLYSSKIYVQYNNRTKLDSTTTDGTGSNPTVNPVLVCPTKAPKTGETADAYLNIANSSKNSLLKINSIEISDSEEFTFANGSKIFNFTTSINANADLDIDLKFTPNGSGKRDVKFLIFADNGIGNEIDEKYNTNEQTIYNSSCQSIYAGGTENVDFGNNLVCDNRSFTFTIPNSDATNNLIIQGNPSITGANTNVFAHNVNNDIIIPPNQSFDLIITFKPNISGIFSGFLTLNNNQNLKLEFDLKGRAEYITHFSSKENNLKTQPGKEHKFYASAKIPDIFATSVNQLSVFIQFDTTMVGFLKDNSKLLINPVSTSPTSTWTIDNSYKKSGEVKVDLNGSIPAPYEGDLFTMDYLIYLGNKTTSDINLFNIYNSCNSPVNFGTKIEITDVCFLKGRLVDVSSQNYSLSNIAPNPVVDNLNIDYSIAFDADLTIDIVSQTGEVVYSVQQSQQKAGAYSLSIPANAIQNGVYWVVLRSSFYEDFKSVIISR